MPVNTAATFLTHFFGSGLVEDPYVVEKFIALVNGDIRRCSDAASTKGEGRRKTKYATASLKSVREMRLARNEIIVCTGLRTPGSVQYLGGGVNGPSVRPPPQRLSGALHGRPAGPPRSATCPRHQAGIRGHRSDARPPYFRFRQGERQDGIPRPVSEKSERPRVVREVDRAPHRGRAMPPLRPAPSPARSLGLRELRGQEEPRAAAPATPGCARKEIRVEIRRRRKIWSSRFFALSREGVNAERRPEVGLFIGFLLGPTRH